jgi:glycine/D-amino acid oxidase-like deaminating enzyme
MMAAATLARSGVRVVVLEAEDPGYGASTRNHGHVGGIGKLPARIETTIGRERAALMKEDAVRARRFLSGLIAEEGLDVDYVECGRFMGAHSPAAYRSYESRAESFRTELGLTVRLVPREEQRSEIGSDFYHGGIVAKEAGSLQPAKLYRAFRRRAEAAGAVICGQARVRGIDRVAGGYRLPTARGTVMAQQVVVATNAYTDGVSPYIRKRLVPVTAYMIATEPMPLELAEEVMPTNRTGGDTKRALYAFRRSPDGRRIVFAGRARFGDIDERSAARILHGFMCGVWPQLRDIRVSHCWKGFVAFTLDKIPHMNSQDGLHYGAGCNGSGVTMMSYLGHQLGLKLLGRQDRPCAIDGLAFPAIPVPGYTGDPWFLPVVGGYYTLRDRLDRAFAA